MAGAHDRLSDEVRELLAVEAVKQASELAAKPKNSASTFKTVVDAADKLFGWSRKDTPGCLIQVGIMQQALPEQPKTPQEQPAKPATEPAGNV